MRTWDGLRLAAVVLLTAAHGWAWIPSRGELWRDGPVPITFDLATTAPASSTGDWDAAAVEALAAWNPHLQRIRLEAAPRTEAAWYENGRNELFFDRNMFNEPFPSDVLAVTAVTFDHGVRYEADVIFNANIRWGVYHGEVSRTIIGEFRRVAIHELGHVLGLSHPDEFGQSVAAIMSSRESDLELPTADDIVGAHGLYDFGPGAPPMIRFHPESATVTQGKTATLSVSAGGRGPLIYQWRRNGVAVAGGTSSTLSWTTKLEDAGDYTVVVSNGSGAVTSLSARLTVLPAAPPAVSIRPPSDPFEVGQTPRLIGEFLSGTLPMTYVWKKGGVPIPNSNDLVLSLPNVQFSDAGLYTLTGSNVAGTATSAPVEVKVVPAQPPTLLSDLASSAVAPGGSVILSAEGKGSGPLTYQWQKDGVNLPGQTGSTLTLAAFRPTDAGRYTVTISNGIGSVTSNASELTLWENADFSILRQPGSVTEFTGATVTFDVLLNASSPPLSLRWLKDGVPLPTTPTATYSGVQTTSLRVANIGASEIGTYAVEISNGRTTVRSTGAKLRVLAPGQLLITTNPATNYATVGSSVTLSVIVKSASTGLEPEPSTLSYQWTKDGQAIAGQTARTCAFTANASNAGGYRVRVTNAANSVESDQADVVIVPVPSIIPVHPPNQLFEANSEELRLNAVAAEVVRRRSQYPVYYYSRGAQALTGSPFDLGDAMPGTYTLTMGFTGATETSRPFTLGFYASRGPTISLHPQGGAFALDQSVSLTVRASPSDGLRYQWYKDGVGISLAVSSTLALPVFSARDLGSYTVLVSNTYGTVISDPAILEIRGVQAPVILTQPASQTIASGDGAEFFVVARVGDFRYQWSRDGRPIVGATNARLTLTSSSGEATAGSYTVFVTDGAVSVTSRAARLDLLPTVRGPQIRMQPSDTVVPLGGDATLVVGADGAPLPGRYQWRRNGVDIPGATDTALRLHNVQPGDAGAYSVVVSNGNGSVVSRSAALTIDSGGRLVNIATRAAVGRGGDILIAGFVIDGLEPRPVLVRGIGDQLSDFGVTGVLRDPLLKLFDAKAQLVASNDDWWRTNEDGTAALQAAAQQAGAFAQRTDTRDAALLVTLQPGSYTAQVSGLASTTGVALVEIYLLGKPGPGRMINLSSRAVVGTGANILIPGLVLDGATPRRLLARAVGPTIADFGVANALSDPVMTILRGEDVVARNDNWSDQAGASLIAAASGTVGAFPLKNGSRDAALLVDLPPGSYTIQVAGVNGATGVALVEIYEVRP